MLSLKENNIFWRALAFSGVLFSVFIHFSNLKTGTPNIEKTQQIFPVPLAAESVERMIQMRGHYYQTVDTMLRNASDLKKKYEELSLVTKKMDEFSKIPEDFILDRARGHLLGVANSDEQRTILALSQLNPIKGRFYPDVFTLYGNVYFYFGGLSLATGKWMGKLSLTSSLNYYFYHPEEVAWMYALVRAVGGIALLLTGIVLYWFIQHAFNERMAALTLLFFILSPILVIYSHSAKPHLVGPFFLLLGTILLWLSIKDTRPLRFVIMGSLLLGLAAGSLMTNLAAGFIILLAEWFRLEKKITKIFRIKYLWIGGTTFLGTFVLTNFHIFLDYGKFKNYLAGMELYMQGYGETYGQIQVEQFFPFLKDLLSMHFGWFFSPLLLLGTFVIIKKQEPLGIFFLIIFCFLFLMDLFFTRHVGVAIRLLPFGAVLLATGTDWMLSQKMKGIQWLCLVWVLIGVFLFILQSTYYHKLYEEPSLAIKAGKWINENIPKNARVGIIEGEIAQPFPPFRFLEYQLVKMPRKELKDIPANLLPEYVLTCFKEDKDLYASSYAETQRWQKPKKLLGISFPDKWVASANNDFFILKKIK